MKYAWIKKHSDSYGVINLGDTLDVSRSGYYQWKQAKSSRTALRAERIAAEAKHVFEENHGSVDYRKVHEELNEDEIE